MKRFQKILVPVDFSSHSDEAIRMGAYLAQKHEASLTLLHVYEPIVYALPEGYVVHTAEQLEHLFAELTKSLEKARALAVESGATDVEARQIDGIAATEIVEWAKKGNYDLIVMGTHGRRGFDRLMMGSVAEKVVRSTPCPLLTVREPTSKAAR